MGEERDFRRNDLKLISKKLGIQKRIIFIRKVKEIYSYPNFSLGISVSKTESFPNAILEYFSLKLPVAAYDIGDIRRLVNNKNGKILKKRDPDYISKKINELYFDKKLAIKSKSAFQKARKFSEINNTLKKYDNIIKTLCVE